LFLLASWRFNITLASLRASAVQLLILFLLASWRFNIAFASLRASAVQLLVLFLLASWRFNYCFSWRLGGSIKSCFSPCLGGSIIGFVSLGVLAVQILFLSASRRFDIVLASLNGSFVFQGISLLCTQRAVNSFGG
jgi:hypothetical protein